MRELVLRFGGIVAAIVACALGSVTPAKAAPLITGLGGPADFGTQSLPANDDDSSRPIDLTTVFPGGVQFFGGLSTRAFVNTNGNVTFDGRLRSYTPSPFPIASQPMIAPFWADVDTRGGGQPDSNGVWWAIRDNQFIVTWNDVGYFARHDDLKMNFQMILTNNFDCGSGDFDVEFRYDRCEWEAGDGSGGVDGFGGTTAQAGFDAGDGENYVAIPGSLMDGIARSLCRMSNVGEPGVWRFGIRDGVVTCPGTGEVCDTGDPGVCGVGVTQCNRDSVECIPVGVVSAESCDGIDNDCNGMTDEGDLCASPEVCLDGTCLPPCFEGGCVAGQVCVMPSGACVDETCVDVACPGGQRCERGECVDPCESVVCPRGRRCIAGRCVDSCDLITCEETRVCVDGACVPACPCRACASEEVCLDDGTCGATGCDMVTCDEGFYCQAGACVDACGGVICPADQHCELGECVPGPPGNPDAGMDSGTSPDTDAGTEDPPPDDSGCGCYAAGRGPEPGWLWIGCLWAVALLRRRARP